MALKVYYSDDIESLAERLFEIVDADTRSRISADGGHSMFGNIKIVVPNINIAKWLKVRMASEHGVCMGMDFPFFDQYLFKELCGMLRAGTRPAKLLSVQDVQLAIAGILIGSGNEELDILRNYCIGESGEGSGRFLYASLCDEDVSRRVWQLSGRLAGYLREYDFHRRKAVDAWLSRDRERPDADEMERAQGKLFRMLFGGGGIFPDYGGAVSLRQLYNRVRGTGGNADGTGKCGGVSYLFGQSMFSELHASIIHEISRCSDVKLFYNTVCVEYWGDVESPWEKIHRLKQFYSGVDKIDKSAAEEEASVENRLLASLGRAGRETMSLLVDLEESGAELIPCEGRKRNPGTVLGALQESVRVRTSDLPRLTQDTSLQVAACPGVVREIETVYNSIIGSMIKNESADAGGTGCVRKLKADESSGFTFSDIAVLVPDINSYRRTIESVFNSRGGIPYCIVDVSEAENSQFWSAVRRLLAFPTGQFGRSEVFGFLEEPFVSEMLNVSAGELVSWKNTVSRLGIRRFFDQKDAARRGMDVNGRHTWDYCLSRARLGRFVDELPDDQYNKVIPNSVYNELFETGEEFFRFSGIVEKLFLETSRFAYAKMKPADWRREILDLVNEYIRIPASFKWEAAVRANFLRLLDSFRLFGSENVEVPFVFVRQYLSDATAEMTARHGGYLTSGVTIASFRPMRPIPFKQIYVVGLDEGVFPGTDTVSSLDMRAYSRGLGDVSPAQINKFLFLETLMAARDRLVLTYVCEDITKNERKFPSFAVRHVEKFIEDNILCAEPPPSGGEPARARFREAEIPLLESDPACMTASNGCFAGLGQTYSTESRIACAYGIDANRALALVKNYAGGRELDSCAAALDLASERDSIINRKAPPVTMFSSGTNSLRLDRLAQFLKKPMETALSDRFGASRTENETDESADAEPADLDWPARKKLINATLAKIIAALARESTEPDSGRKTNIPEWRDIFENEYGALGSASRTPGSFMSKSDEFNQRHEAENLFAPALFEFVRREFSAAAECRMFLAGKAAPQDFGFKCCQINCVVPTESGAEAELIGMLPFVFVIDDQYGNPVSADVLCPSAIDVPSLSESPRGELLECVLFALAMRISQSSPCPHRISVCFISKGQMYRCCLDDLDDKTILQFFSNLVSDYDKENFVFFDMSFFSDINKNNRCGLNEFSNEELSYYMRKKLDEEHEKIKRVKNYNPLKINELLNVWRIRMAKNASERGIDTAAHEVFRRRYSLFFNVLKVEKVETPET